MVGNSVRIWEVSVAEESLRDFDRLKKNDPGAIDEIKQVMHNLACLPDPRQSYLVQSMKWDCPGWFRVAAYRYNTRTIFFIVQQDECGLHEIGPHDELIENSETNFIIIAKTGQRAEVYNGARRRQKEIRRNRRQ